MITLRQIERLWLAGNFSRMLHALLEMRPENSLRLSIGLTGSAAAAAMAVIRLDELSQPHAPFAAKMLRTVLAAQEADGGWGNPLVTALCLRALLCRGGDGPAIDRGLQYLANLQKPEGAWPLIPLRRLPADPFVSAFILYQLGDCPQFHDAVRFDAALDYLRSQESEMDGETRRLWRGISLRQAPARSPEALIWS